MTRRRGSTPDPVTRAVRDLQQKAVAYAIKTPEFREVMGEAADEIRREATPTATEATIEGVIERVVYSRLRDIGFPRFHPVKETGVNLLRSIVKGRTDSRIGTLVIEYKRPSLMSTAAEVDGAREQLEDYLTSIGDTTDDELVGFLTNGLKIVEVRSVHGAITSRSPVGDVTSDALARLVRVIVATDETALTAENLIRDFCDEPDGALFRVARTLRESLITNRTPKTTMLFSEWEALFSLAHDDVSQQRRIEDRRRALGGVFAATLADPPAEYSALFALHTAYAIVLKLIAYRVVSDLYFQRIDQPFHDLAGSESPALRVACEALEDGEVFRQLGITNLLEGDFFSWYADPAQWNDEMAATIRDVISVLARYEEVGAVFAAGAVADLFRELYEATVPREVRSSFGEFYTPQWLAQDVLETALSGEGWRVIDPCCGSGTFLVTAIARLRRESGALPPSELLEAILSRIAGVDLNPLGVLTSRVHFFIHVSDLIDSSEPREITIPVFLGDSSSTPIRQDLDGVACLSYDLKTLRSPIQAVIPVSAVERIGRFFAVVREYEAEIRVGDRDAAVRVLMAAIPRRDRRRRVRDALESLTDDLIKLEEAGWNGIWARILANFLATACVGRFSAVVGNPPWIDWKNLPAGYRQSLKEMEIVRDIFSGAGRTGGINLNICALISYVTADQFLADGGRLAFLMPRELIYQASYEGWRRLGGRASIIRLQDWSTAGHPFDPVREDFMTYVIAKEPPLPEVPVAIYRKRDGTSASKWPDRDEAMKHLEVTEAVAGQVIAGKTAFTLAADRAELEKFALVAGECAYYGREGIEFYPQELLLFTYDGPGARPGTVWVKNIQVERSKHRIPQRRRLLETRYLYPLVKGPAIESFHHAYQGLIVAFPYESGDPHRPVPRAQLRRSAPLLHNYYMRHQEVFEAQTEFSDRIRGEDRGEFYGLARTGPYSFGQDFVALRDNSKWRAVVVSDSVMPWGERRRFVFQNHAVSICERKDDGRTFISQDEAHYICSILSAPTVERFILASSDERSFNIRPPVYVPPFNPRDRLHRQLVTYSRRAHADPSTVDSVRRAIERTYLRMCARRNPAST